LQTVLSAHDAPFMTAVFWQPVAATHESVVQTLLSLQFGADPLVQLPATQVSAPLQALPSEHDVPSITFECAQPEAGSHVSFVQGLLSLQFGAVPLAQVPPWQVSTPLQALPSEHDVPLVTAVFLQPVVWSQESAVHGLLSLQFGAVPDAHDPAWQVSAPLHALPSEHDVPSITGVFLQPVAESQASLVHGVLSLQFGAVPFTQDPDWHVC
jgi:hypothetical protein